MKVCWPGTAKLPKLFTVDGLALSAKASFGVSIAVAGVCLLGAAGYWEFHDRYPEYHALMDAISRRDVTAVRTLLAKGVKPNVYPPPSWNEDDQAPINAAADTGDITITGMLLDAGADIETSDPWGGPPLDLAARNDDVDMLRFLISRGAKVNDLGKDGSFALYGAAVEGKSNAVKCLLAQGANPGTRVGDTTALRAAQMFGYGPTAAILEQAQKG